MATNAVALVAAASYAAQPTRHYSKDVLRTSCLNKTPHDAIRSHWLSVHLQAQTSACTASAAARAQTASDVL